MIFIAEPYREILGQIGTSPETIFTDPAIKPWRILEDRENCTWDVLVGGRRVRLHVKRFRATNRRRRAQAEAEGYRALHERGIATATVAAWGRLDDGRSFIVTEDLAGFAPADKLVEGGEDFDRFLIPTADLAARLHNAGLHHRDLYLCHFLARGARTSRWNFASSTPPGCGRFRARSPAGAGSSRTSLSSGTARPNCR